MTTLIEQSPPWLRDLNRFLGSQGAPSSFNPPADVLVNDAGVAVYMDLPGVSPDQLEIELENDVLSVRGERPYPYGADDGGMTRRIERSFGQFERSLRVPRGLDPGSIEASLANGVLSMNIPKPESLKPHKIQVKAGDEAPQLETAQS
jgi:HSP20 family protein